MTKENFRYIWENMLLPCINDLYQEIDEQDRKNYKIERVIPNNEEQCQFLEREYNRIKENFKKFFFDTGINKNNKIDFHKIGACLCQTILENPIFKYTNYDKNKKIPISVSSLNYGIAFFSALYFLHGIFKISYEKYNATQYKELVDNDTFIFPKVNDYHDPYHLGQIKILMLCDIYGVKFNALHLSDTLFWIDFYNTHCLPKK